MVLLFDFIIFKFINVFILLCVICLVIMLFNCGNCSFIGLFSEDLKFNLSVLVMNMFF